MARPKNKQQKKKPRKDVSVFKVAGSGTGSKISKKQRPKAVTTNFKKINALTRNKTSLVDGAFGDVKEMIMSTQKQPGGSQPNQIQKSKPNATPDVIPDVEVALENFAKL